jgi:multisubunit Na+/H+ antiporter MnhG subunit
MLMLLLKSFVCAVVTLGVIRGAMDAYSRLDEFGQSCVWGAIGVMTLTFCFFCVFADI